MRLYSILIPVLLLFFNCSTDVEFQTWEIEPLTDVLTLELSFGDEKTIDKDDFLLARPFGLAVADNGDIIVTDESRLKVYDKDGNPKQVIGRPGQGPGEFGRFPMSSIGLSDYLVTTEFRGGYNLFSPEFKFIEKKYMRNDSKLKNFLSKNNRSFNMIKGITFFNENEKVYSIDASDRSRENREFSSDYLLYQNNDTLIVLAEYTTLSKVYDENTGMIVPRPSVGQFHWAELSDRRLVYVHTEHDVMADEGNFSFTFTIISIDNFETETVTQTYIPTVFPDSIKQKSGTTIRWEEGSEMNEKAKNLNKRLSEIIKSTEYYLPIIDIRTDGDYIFIFTDKKNDLGHTLVKVFNAATKSQSSAAYFPLLPVIRNGYVYILGKNEEGFYIVEKYKLDPAVYGK